MNNRFYQNNQFLHPPDGWGNSHEPEGLKGLLKFTEEAYEQLLHDLTSPETPACIHNGRVYFGMDQAVSAPIGEVLENIVLWFQNYEARLYGESLTTDLNTDIVDGVAGAIKSFGGISMVHDGNEWVVI